MCSATPPAANLLTPEPTPGTTDEPGLPLPHVAAKGQLTVLLVGGGGREHALAQALARSPLLGRLIAAPGNPGIGQLAQLAPVAASDVAALVALAQAERVDFVVVGPEAPLAAGLVDALAAVAIPAFGPMAAGARLEASKVFMKQLVEAAGIPTAAWVRVHTMIEAEAALQRFGAPVVVKADGLAAGKGVTVAASLAEARAAVTEILAGGAHGGAGAGVVIEQCLIGTEASLFALFDGRTILPFGHAQDYKRACDDDRGPNTGGMGAVSPAPAMTQPILDLARETILEPTARALAEQAGTLGRFVGFLFAGLMLVPLAADAAPGAPPGAPAIPFLLEYNVRLGDPEAEVILPRLRHDLLALLLLAYEGRLDEVGAVAFAPQAAVTVVMASQGYPGAVKTGAVLTGLERAASLPGVTVYQAGTAEDAAGDLVASGGRVLAVTGLAPSQAEARARAYAGVDAIDFPGGFCRRDIARAL